MSLGSGSVWASIFLASQHTSIRNFMSHLSLVSTGTYGRRTRGTEIDASATTLRPSAMRWNLPGCRPGRNLHGALAFRTPTLFAIFLKDPSESSGGSRSAEGRVGQAESFQIDLPRRQGTRR